MGAEKWELGCCINGDGGNHCDVSGIDHCNDNCNDGGGGVHDYHCDDSRGDYGCGSYEGGDVDHCVDVVVVIGMNAVMMTVVNKWW